MVPQNHGIYIGWYLRTMVLILDGSQNYGLYIDGKSEPLYLH